jgi:BNR repeat-like domain
VRRQCAILMTSILLSFCLFLRSVSATNEGGDITWTEKITADNPATYQDKVLDARGWHAGRFGDDYPRAVKLTSGSWLLVFTSYGQGDSGYLLDPKGGNILVVMRSNDNCKTWTRIAQIIDQGRDLDNGEMIQLPDGDVLLAARSVRWQESYRLPVYKSTDLGATWTKISQLDGNEGSPGTLGKPDKGVYEPHFYQLGPKLLGVMYSTEKHVTESPSYSQTVAEKLSTDGGATWGKEIWVASGNSADRPGMPVWTKMNNGRYIVVYEVGGPKDYPIYRKTSADGVKWEPGLGEPIAFGRLIPRGAPYVISLPDGRLVLTSNDHKVEISNDFGKSWLAQNDAFPGSAEKAFFSSTYQVDSQHITLMTGLARSQGGRSIAIRIGAVPKISSLPANP